MEIKENGDKKEKKKIEITRLKDMTCFVKIRSIFSKFGRFLIPPAEILVVLPNFGRFLFLPV